MGIDVSREVARVLHANGIGKPEPTPFTEEDVKKYSEMVRLISSASENIHTNQPSVAWRNSCIIMVRMRAPGQIALVNLAGRPLIRAKTFSKVSG